MVMQNGSEVRSTKGKLKTFRTFKEELTPWLQVHLLTFVYSVSFTEQGQFGLNSLFGMGNSVKVLLYVKE